MTRWMVRTLVDRSTTERLETPHLIGVVTVGMGLPAIVACGDPYFSGMSLPLVRASEERGGYLYITSLATFVLNRGDLLKLRRTGVLRIDPDVVVRLIEEN